MIQKDSSTASVGSSTDFFGSPEELQSYFFNAPVAIAVVASPDLHFTIANQLFLFLVGKSHEEVIGRYVAEVMPSSQFHLKDSLDQVIRTGKRYECKELRIDKVTNDKTDTQYFNFVYDPIKDSNGRLSGIYVSAYEVTEQVNAKLKLQENENRFHTFADSMPFLISYIDNNECYQLTNKWYEDWFGRSPEQVKGIPMRELLGEDAYQAIRPYVKRALAGERVSYESKVNYIKKGETFIHATYIPDIAVSGEVHGFYVLVEDITERRVADDKIKESEFHFRKMTDTVPAIIWITDKDGYCTYLNKHWYDLTGQTEEEALGFGWLKATHPEDCPGAEKAFLEANAKQTDFLTMYRLRHSDGQYRWVIDRGSPRYDASGKFEGITGSVVDIHQQKIAEEQIRDSESNYRSLAEQLEKLVAERTRELQRSNEDLQQFAHVASHDLKEPVRKVKTFIDKLLRDHGQDVPEKALYYLNKIDKSCDRMNLMVEGVLQYSTVNAMEATSEKVDLNSIIETIESELEVVITRKNAIISKENLTPVNGSPILLFQLFYNLINNSLKFSHPDRAPYITISSKAAATHELTNAGLNPGSQYLHISVTDNGIGFESHEAEKIFGTFTRLNAKDQFEGTGLGLSLCRSIVTRHGGVIIAKGEENKGATFSIFLPPSAQS